MVPGYDVGVYDSTEQEHDNNIHSLMETASKHGLVFNEKKCQIKTHSLSFFGPLFDKDGVYPDPDRAWHGVIEQFTR